MRTLAAAFTALTLLAASSSLARAQAGPIELGVDGALRIFLEDPRVVTLDIPFDQFRVGFFTSPTLSVEPTLGLNFARSGGENFTAISLGVGFLFHFAADRGRSRTYFRPFGGFTSVSAFGTSESNAHLGLGFGVKTPLATRLASRFEAFLAHQFDAGGVTSVGGLFGLSFFPR
jgi:hypothetical protein